MKLKLISDKDQKHSTEKLNQYYKDDLIPPEKKTYLTDLVHSRGPYMGIEGENGEPSYLMDAASQIATLGLGFNPSVFFGVAHLQESWTNNNKGEEYLKLKKAFHNFLQRKTGMKEQYVTFRNSGAEANETALGLCFKNRKNKKAKKVLAFEGSFHGRMMVTLAATWNKVKREPFEWKEAGTIYCPLPAQEDSIFEKNVSKEWKETWSNSTLKSFDIPKHFLADGLVKEEVNSLLAVRDHLISGEIFSIIIEPMQCEGGDRYISPRYHTALLLMARSFNVEVVHDEVQTGFHLGKEFFWHKELDMTDENGKDLSPDHIVCAKKAQVGIVISKGKNNKQDNYEEVQVASVMRGYLHAISLDQSQDQIKGLEDLIRPLLNSLVNKYSTHITSPRLNGMAFAFDINDQNKVAELIKVRFNYGLLYYPAGSNTLRFRVNTSFKKTEIEFLFTQLDKICSEVFDNKKEVSLESGATMLHETERLYEWHKILLETKLNIAHGRSVEKNTLLSKMSKLFQDSIQCDLIEIDDNKFSKYKDQIINIQKQIYEPARQTSITKFEEVSANINGLALGLIKDGELLAMAFCSPLKSNPLERGVRLDPNFEDETCLYMLDTTVTDELQGQGVGRNLKYALTLLAKASGIKRIQGRNRDRMAASMLNINLSLGSIEQLYIKEDYPDFETYRDVLYYTSKTKWEKEDLNLSNGLNSLYSIRSLSKEHINDQLPYVINKVCLSNFVSERFLQQLTSLTSKLPNGLRHAYTTSGQSECTDKLAKTMWFNSDKKTNKMLTFKGHFFGNGSFFSRSLSEENDNFFPVTHLEGPNGINNNEILKELESELDKENYLAVWIEPLLQKSMEKVSHDFLVHLKSICNKKNVNLIYNETASSAYRYDNQDYFISNKESIRPDAGFVFLGGQGGLCFMKRDLFIEKPLMLISTWDGDEFSLSNYNKVLNEIQSDVASHIKLQESFQERLSTFLKKYNIHDIQLTNGNGSFKGDIPYSYQRYFSKNKDRFIVCPSRDAMKDFLELNL
jgi:acetylornithine/succinyldiaminopimelate/putrescine aminotransferase/GNAT superfamily N-acetyltransferase